MRSRKDGIHEFALPLMSGAFEEIMKDLFEHVKPRLTDRGQKAFAKEQVIVTDTVSLTGTSTYLTNAREKLGMLFPDFLILQVIVGSVHSKPHIYREGHAHLEKDMVKRLRVSYIEQFLLQDWSAS